MVTRFLKRFALWLLLSFPVGVGAGAVVSAFLGADAKLDRATSAVNGALAGASLSLIGAWVAAATVTMWEARLLAAGGSNLLTGAIIAYGFVAIGLAVLTLVD